MPTNVLPSHLAQGTFVLLVAMIRKANRDTATKNAMRTHDAVYYRVMYEALEEWQKLYVNRLYDHKEI